MQTRRDFCLALQAELSKALPCPSLNPLRMTEAQLTLAELNRLLEQYADSTELNREALEPFQAFLANRWERIRGTDACYPHNPAYPLNQTCLWLAQELAKFTLPEQGSHALLMPGVDVNSLVDTELNELPLHHFILSDDNHSWIPISYCLHYAETDGVLKHIATLDDFSRPKALSETEQDRLLQSSPEAAAYHQAISALMHFRHDLSKELLGAAIQALIDGLLAGSIKGTEPDRGDELNSGEKANVATAVFHEYLAKLDKKAKDKLFALTAPGHSDSFGELWGRLSHPANVKLTDRYCVYLIQSSLQAILNENRKKLYGASLLELETHVAQTRAAFDAAHEKNPSLSQSSYNEHGERTLLAGVSSHQDFIAARKKTYEACLPAWTNSAQPNKNLLEQLELLTLFNSDLALDEEDHEKQASLLRHISDSWEAIVDSRSPAQRGELLYHLLIQPSLAEDVQKKIKETKTTEEFVGQQLYSYATRIDKRNPQKGSECYAFAASLGNHFAMSTLAAHYLEAPQNWAKAWAKALVLLKQSYPLWDEEKDRKRILNNLTCIALQTADPKSSTEAIEALAALYKKRWKLPLANGLSLRAVHIEKIIFFAVLSKQATLAPEEKGGTEQLTPLASEISGFWPSLLNSSLTPLSSQRLLHLLLTAPLLRDGARAEIHRQRWEKLVGGHLNDYGKSLLDETLQQAQGEQFILWSKTALESALESFELGASLGNRSCMWNLALSYHRSNTLGSGVQSVRWSVKSYRLSMKEAERKEILVHLNALGKQTTDPEAQQAAIAVLKNIYKTRWSQPPTADFPSFHHLSEKAGFLNLLANQTGHEEQKKTLVKEILASWQEALDPRQSLAERGRLLHSLLTPLLGPTLLTIIMRKNLMAGVGLCLNGFGDSRARSQRELATECYRLGAALRQPSSMSKLARHLQQEDMGPRLTEAVGWHKEAYGLWDSDVERQKILEELKTIASQQTDIDAARAARTFLITLLRQRCSHAATLERDPVGVLVDRIDLLALLRKDPDGQITTPDHEQEMLELHLRASWQETILTPPLHDSFKGELLHRLITQALPLQVLLPEIQNKQLEWPLTHHLDAFAHKMDAEGHRQKGAEAYEIGAQLNSPVCMWQLARYHHTLNTPPSLAIAVRWYEHSYPIWSKEKDRQDVLNKLKIIAAHPDAPAESQAALAALGRIYSQRWQVPPVNAVSLLAEKIDFVNLLLLNGLAPAEEKAHAELLSEITGSWDGILASSLSIEQQGELLNRLLTQPLLSEAIYLELTKDTDQYRTKAVSLRLNRFGLSHSKEVGPNQRSFESYQIGAKLENPYSMWNLALFYNEATPPNLIEALYWFEETYSFWTDESDKKDILRNLLKIAQQTTNPFASQAATAALDKIYCTRWQTPLAADLDATAVFSEKIDYLTLLAKNPATNPTQEHKIQPPALAQQLCASLEEVLKSSEHNREEKGEILHRLLTLPPPLRTLAEGVYRQIEEKKLEIQVSNCLNAFGRQRSQSRQASFEAYQIGAKLENPYSMWWLAHCYAQKTPRQFTEEVTWLEKSYFLWDRTQDREEVLVYLRTLAQQTTVERCARQQAKRALDKIYFLNKRLLQTWKQAILFLPPLADTETRTSCTIILEDGREKRVTAEVAAQWRILTNSTNNFLRDHFHFKTLVEDTHTLEKLRQLTQDKTSADPQVQAYYTLFANPRLDLLSQQAAQKQLHYFSSPTYWHQQLDGIFRILEKASQPSLPETKEATESHESMIQWVEQFGAAQPFLKINAHCQDQLLHRILEQVLRGQPLAVQLEEHLLSAWGRDNSASAKTALVYYYQKKLAFLNRLEEEPSAAKTATAEALGLARLAVYNASWQGRMGQLSRDFCELFATRPPVPAEPVHQASTHTIRVR